MATATTTANSAPQTIFTVPTPMKAKPTEINIDNEGSSGPVTIQINDTFTTSPGVVNPTPSTPTVLRFQVTVNQGVSFSADVLSLEGIEFLGAVSVVNIAASGVVADCVIIVGYKLE